MTQHLSSHLLEPDERNAKRIVIFGGAFNPVHIVHETVMTFLLDQGYDYVIVVPTGERRDKLNQLSFVHRIAMLKLAIAEHFSGETALRVKDWQGNGSLPDSTTYTLLETLSGECPGGRIEFAVGDELLVDIPSWCRNPLERFHFVVLPRTAQPHDRFSHPNLRRLEGGEWLLSGVTSTYVRRAISLGLRTNAILANSVRRYIDEHGLYK